MGASLLALAKSIYYRILRFGLKASYLVKMLLLQLWLISDMEPSRILMLTRDKGMLLEWDPFSP